MSLEGDNNENFDKEHQNQSDNVEKLSNKNNKNVNDKTNTNINDIKASINKKTITSPYEKYKYIKNTDNRIYGDYIIKNDLGKFKYYSGKNKTVEITNKDKTENDYMHYPAKKKKVNIVKAKDEKYKYDYEAKPKNKIVDNLPEENYKSWQKYQEQISKDRKPRPLIENIEPLKDERTTVNKKYNYKEISNKNNASSQLHKNENLKNDKKSLFKKLKKNNRSSKKGKFIGINYTVIAICILIAVFFAILYIGNSLSGGKWFGQNVSYSSKTYYAVGRKTINKDQAEALAHSMRCGGGAGYALQVDDGYIVIAEIYETEEQAKTVMEKSSNKEFFNCIHKFVIENYNLNKVPNNMALVVKDGLLYFDITFYKLFEMSRALDLKEIDNAEAISRLNRIIEELTRKKNFFDKNVKNSSDSNILELRAQIMATLSILQNLTNNNVPRPNLVCDIRYSYIILLNTHIQLINSSK